MPTRMLRDGILTSERVARLGWPEEVFYRRLMSAADDHGRFYALPALVRAACYPLHLEKVSDSDIEKWLTACVNAALVRVYSASDGKRYVEIRDFGQRIQGKSKFPAPPDGHGDLPDSTETNGSSPESTVDHGDSPEPTVIPRLVVVEDVVEIGSTRKRGTRANKTELPSDFCITDRVRQWAATKGHTRLDEHLEAFKAKCRANGYRYANWDDAFMEAIRGDWAKLTQSRPAREDQGSPASRRALT